MHTYVQVRTKGKQSSQKVDIVYLSENFDTQCCNLAVLVFYLETREVHVDHFLQQVPIETIVAFH